MRPSSFLIGFQAGTEAGRPLVQAKMQKLADERRAVQRSRELAYSSQQAAAERALRERLQTTGQTFTAGENDKDRALRERLQVTGQTFTAGENNKDRSEAMKRQLLTNAAANARAGEQNKLTYELAQGRKDIAEQELAIRKQEFELKNKSPVERTEGYIEDRLNKVKATRQELEDVNLAMKSENATPEQLKELRQQKSLLESRLTAITSSMDSFAASINKSIADGNIDAVDKTLSLFTNPQTDDSYTPVTFTDPITGEVMVRSFNRNTGELRLPDSLIPRTGEPGGSTGTTTGAGSEGLIKNPSDIPFGTLDKGDRLTTTPSVIDATKKSVFASPESISAPNYPFGSQTKGPLAK